MPTNCVWLDGLSSNVSDQYLTRHFCRYGPVVKVGACVWLCFLNILSFGFSLCCWCFLFFNTVCLKMLFSGSAEMPSAYKCLLLFKGPRFSSQHSGRGLSPVCDSSTRDPTHSWVLQAPAHAGTHIERHMRTFKKNTFRFMVRWARLWI